CRRRDRRRRRRHLPSHAGRGRSTTAAAARRRRRRRRSPPATAGSAPGPPPLPSAASPSSAFGADERPRGTSRTRKAPRPASPDPPARRSREFRGGSLLPRVDVVVGAEDIVAAGGDDVGAVGFVNAGTDENQRLPPTVYRRLL